MKTIWCRAARVVIVPFLLLVLVSQVRALTLEQALEETLLHNPEILAARDRIQEAIGMRMQLRSLALPRIGITAGGGLVATSDSPNPTESIPNQFVFAQARLLQTLFDARVPVAWAQGGVGVLVAQQEVNVRATTAMHSARLAFYQAQNQRELVDLLAKSKDSLFANLRREEERLALGTVSRGEVLRAQLAARAMEPLMISAAGNYRSARIALARAMGRPLGPDADLPVPEGKLVFQNIDYDVARETAAALERRPDLKLLRATMRALHLEKRGLQAGYFPVVGLSVREQGVPVGGVSGTGGSESFLNNRTITTEYEFVEQFTWKIIDNGEIGGAVTRQQKTYEISEILLEKLERDVPRNLMRIRQNLQSIEARRKALSATVADAEKTLEIVAATITAGAATQLDYRNAQRSLIQVQVGILNTAFEQSSAIAEWDLAAGRYLQFVAPSAGR
jgi:outer membrane protein